MILKRRIVPTGEPDNTERVPSGSVGGWGKRSVSYLARSLPNLRSRFRRRLTAGVRLLGNQGYNMSSQYENVVKGGTHGNTDHYHSCQP